MLVQKIPQWLKYLSSLLPTCLPIVNCSNKMLCTRHTTANTDVSLVRMRACVSVHDFRISCLLKFAPFLYKFKRKYKNLHHQSIKLKKKSRPTFDTKTNKINHTKKKPNKIADGPAVVRVNIFVRSISKIDDVTMVSLSQQILLHKYLDNLLANQTKQIK